MSFFRNLLIERKRKPYYCEVEYLESTGTQWIDTGINVDTSTDEIKLYFQLTDTALYKWFFGEYDTNARLGLGSGDGADKRNFLYQQSATKVSDTQMYDKQHLFEINSNGGFLDGTKIRDYVNFASTSTIYLFNLNIDSPSDYRCKSKIWKYEHKRNGVLIRDMVGVLDWNMSPCMYDKVTRKLFYNKGTGDFSYGREIHPVDYLESTGTQYIDTKINPTDDYGYRIKNTYAVGQGEQCAIGCMDSGNRFVGIYTSGSANAISGAWGDYVGFLPSYPWTTDTILDVKCNYKNSRKIVIGDTEMKDISDVHITGTIGNSIYIGARHYGTNVTKMQGEIYGVEITKGQEVIADFIPAIDELGVGFMFDRVTHTIFDNAGTGEFNYPPVELEYLESTGTQYIDTNTEISSTTTILIDASLESYVQWSNSCGGIPSSSGYFCLPFGWTNSNTRARSIYGADAVGTGEYDFNYTLGKRVKLLYNDNKKLYIDDIHVFTFNYNKQTPPSTQIFQFGRYSNACGAKFYGVKMWDNGYNSNLVADYIPAFKDGSAGMWDKVNNVFYGNAGTGTFVAGKILESRWF